MPVKRILLIATGGTIAQTDTGNGLAPGLNVDSLLDFAPEVRALARIEAVQLFNKDSTNIRPEDWIEIVRFAQKVYGQYDGIVVLHGTDTMGYTSAALSYMMQNLPIPVVLTGSQRPVTHSRTDAGKNLLDAVRFACEPLGGVYVVFAGTAIFGTRAVKIKTQSDDAFASVNFPCAAAIEGARIRYNVDLRRTYRAENAPRFYTSLCPDVLVLKLIPGLKTDLFEWVKSRYKGVIVETYGRGGLPFEGENSILDKIAELTSAGAAVVITTQCMWEGSDLTVYEVGRKALELPVIPAFDMTTEAAAAKLMWVLANAKTREEVRSMFLTPVNFDLSISAENEANETSGAQ
jgi:L-asparaginase